MQDHVRVFISSGLRPFAVFGFEMSHEDMALTVRSWKLRLESDQIRHWWVILQLFSVWFAGQGDVLRVFCARKMILSAVYEWICSGIEALTHAYKRKQQVLTRCPGSSAWRAGQSQAGKSGRIFWINMWHGPAGSLHCAVLLFDYPAQSTDSRKQILRDHHQTMFQNMISCHLIFPRAIFPF